MISVQNDREWQAFCRGFGDAALGARADFATNGDRVASREAVDAAVAAHLGRHSREETIAMLDAARIAYGRLSDMEDLATHPQSRFARVETSTGPLMLLGPAPVADGVAPVALGEVPDLDRHGAAIRAEFGPARVAKG